MNQHASPRASSPETSDRRRWLRFARHYVEMIIAMFAGMIVLGLLENAAGLDLPHERYPEPAYLVMAVNMSAGMAAWMRLRGHGRRGTLEMCGAMFAPALPLFPLIWLGVIDGMVMMTIAHVIMFPLMLAVMFWRRDEYLHGPVARTP